LIWIKPEGREGVAGADAIKRRVSKIIRKNCGLKTGPARYKLDLRPRAIDGPTASVVC